MRADSNLRHYQSVWTAHPKPGQVWDCPDCGSVRDSAQGRTFHVYVRGEQRKDWSVRCRQCGSESVRLRRTTFLEKVKLVAQRYRLEKTVCLAGLILLVACNPQTPALPEDTDTLIPGYDASELDPYHPYFVGPLEAGLNLEISVYDISTQEGHGPRWIKDEVVVEWERNGVLLPPSEVIDKGCSLYDHGYQRYTVTCKAVIYGADRRVGVFSLDY